MRWLLARLNHRDGAVAMWKKNTMLPFKAAKPFFSSSEKPPLSCSPSFSPRLLCQELSRLFSQLGGWKSDRGATGRDRNEGGKDRLGDSES